MVEVDEENTHTQKKEIDEENDKLQFFST